MGTYDTVAVNGKYEQTKALGKGMRVFQLGDTVRIVPAPLTFEDLERFSDGTIEPLDVEDFQFELSEGWGVVLNNVLVDCVSERITDQGLPSFDYLGRPLQE